MMFYFCHFPNMTFCFFHVPNTTIYFCHVPDMTFCSCNGLNMTFYFCHVPDMTFCSCHVPNMITYFCHVPRVTFYFCNVLNMTTGFCHVPRHACVDIMLKEPSLVSKAESTKKAGYCRGWRPGASLTLCPTHSSVRRGVQDPERHQAEDHTFFGSILGKTRLEG